LQEYDFNKLLSPLDFELLSRDLIQRELGVTFESFKEGRDQGIDFKFSTFTSTNSIVLQCKNYKNDYSYFLRELKKELEKVKKLNPERYMITTSVNLSNANKEEIREYFSPYILKTSDIYGGNDLNNLLSKSENNDIEKQHSKLWLASINILDRVLHSNIHCQSEMLLEEIELKIPFCVYSQSYEEALTILNKERCCIISGNPGVGKTTLAYMLLLEFIKNEENFEIIEIKSFDEANKVWNRDKKQVFYFDDFLGKNFRTIKLDKNEDSNIARLMKRVSRYENKYIIFTTREYILNQAKHDYEELSGADFELTKMIIDINRYNNKIKAEILYNHLHFSSLPDEYVYELLIDNSFLDIINHKNYNPRIIEHLTNIKLLEKSDIEVEAYREYFLDNLDSPIKIWSDIFENDKVSFEAKILISILFVIDNLYSSSKIYALAQKLQNIERLFNDLYTYSIEMNRTVNKGKTFNKVLKELENSFIKIEKWTSKFYRISLYDPSLNDYLFEYFNKNTTDLIDLISGMELFSQLDYSLSNIFNFDNNQNDKRFILNGELKHFFVDSIIQRGELNIEEVFIVDEIITNYKIRLNDKLDDVIKKSLKMFDLYQKVQAYNDVFTYIYKADDLYYYIELSRKYKISIYKNQEIYNVALDDMQVAHNLFQLQSYHYVCNLKNIKRSKDKEEGYIERFFEYGLDDKSLKELESMYQWVMRYKDEFRIGEQRISILRDEIISATYEKEEDTKKNIVANKNIDVKEIINLFDGLRE